MTFSVAFVTFVFAPSPKTAIYQQLSFHRGCHTRGNLALLQQPFKFSDQENQKRGHQPCFSGGDRNKTSNRFVCFAALSVQRCCSAPGRAGSICAATKLARDAFRR